MIESTSSQVFEDLRHLDHAVVLFDECDELFRDRGSAESSRNIMSFVTACMLPKLQDLHDDRRVIFVLGTNYLHRIDDAIRRPGRFDAVLLLDRPDETARAKIVLECWPNGGPPERALLVTATAGWMTKEIRRAAQQKAKGLPDPADVSNDDYCKWCKDIGPKELAASRLTQPEMKDVEARWKPFSDRASPSQTIIV